MPNVKIYDMTGKDTGTKDLSENIFDVEVNEAILHTAVRTYLVNQRVGTQSTLTRGEVSGGGKKPWRQKGTGRARQGSTRSPQWTHGGIALGPKPRDYRISMNKKEKRLALKSALSSKVKSDELVVVDSIATEEYRTKVIMKMLEAFGMDKKKKKALIVVEARDAKIIKSAANIPGVKTAIADNLNVYDILNCDKFIASSKAIDKIEEVYA